jgi:hypothetical protein
MKYHDLFIRFVLIVVGFLMGLVINHYSRSQFTPDILSNYLISVGAMIGGTIAIVFTISIFLIQNTADLCSSKYFEGYIHDWKEKWIYFIVIVITIIFFGAGQYIGSFCETPKFIEPYIVIVSLLLIGIVFALIDWQYKIVRKKINPSEAIHFLEEKDLRFLSKLKADAQRIAGIIHLRDSSVSKEMVLATTYSQFMQPYINNLDRQIENLFEISMRLANRQELETARQGFTAIHNIISKFLEIRKTSSLALSSEIALFTVESDSHNFLSRNFERLNKAGEKFIKENKDEIAIYIIDIYNSLAIVAKEVKLIGQRVYDNPIIDNLVGYLNFFIDAGTRAKNIEVVYQGSGVLREIAIIAADKGLSTTLRGIQEKLLSIAKSSLTEKQTVIVDLCNSIYLRIIEAVFLSKKVNAEEQFKIALQNIATIAKYTFTFIKSGYLPDNFTISLIKVYDDLGPIIVKIINRYYDLTDKSEKRSYRSDIIELFKELYSSLRTLSEDLKNCESILINSIGGLNFIINNLIIQLIEKKEFSIEKKELKERLRWNIHLPEWFVHHAERFDGSSIPFNTLTDSVAKTGIIIIKTIKDKALLIDCINSLYSITKQALEKTISNYGFDEPRVLEKVCYLGILALKNGWYDVFSEVGLKIYDFEPNYLAKYFSNLPKGIDPDNHNVIGLPKKNQLNIELLKWRNDFNYEKLNGSWGILDDTESMMYPLIEQLDIDRFMFEVWGIYPLGSKIKKEIEERIEKRAIIRKLTILIKKRVRSLYKPEPS